MADRRLTLVEHLEELRKRFIISLISLLGFSILSFVWAKKILGLLTRPVERLIFISPVELFLVYIKLSIFCGFILSLPVILYQIWRFVSIGLTEKEKRYIFLFFPPSLILFFLGMCFAYFIIVPFGVKFLLGFATEDILPMITVSKYISFVTVLILGTGFVFLLPAFVFLLSRFGIITPGFLRKNYKFAVIIIFIVAAIITPSPDVFTQALLALPLLILYEISIWVSRI